MIDIKTAPEPAYVVALKRLVPESERIKSRIRKVYPDEDYFWKVTPKPFEESLVAAYVSIIEKQTVGTLTRDDVTDLSAILRWITETPKLGETSQRRHPLLWDDAKETMYRQIARLQSPDFMEKADWGKQMVIYLRSHMQRLINHRVLEFENSQELFNFEGEIRTASGKV